jgi:hypothetical protein
MFAYVRLTGKFESLCASPTIAFPSGCVVARVGFFSARRDATALRQAGRPAATLKIFAKRTQFSPIACDTTICSDSNAPQEDEIPSSHPHLTPAQWLPKPATNQVPSKSLALRALWSPPSEGAEREKMDAAGEKYRWSSRAFSRVFPPGAKKIISGRAGNRKAK